MGLVTSRVLAGKYGVTRQHLHYLVKAGHISPKLDPGPGSVKLYEEQEVKAYLERENRDGRAKPAHPS
ncbi:hypothetical protein ACFL4Y_03715 [Gemmatimonadota bacterium]